jgi:nucleotide-binding universal stress UspA family protein
MSREILVPMDSAEQSEKALRRAIEDHPEADLKILHAYGIEDTSAARGAVITLDDEVLKVGREHAETIFEEAREIAADAGYEGEIETVAQQGDPEAVITDHAEEADIVYIGSHSRTGSTPILLGSVAEKVVRRSPVSVMVVK